MRVFLNKASEQAFCVICSRGYGWCEKTKAKRVVRDFGDLASGSRHKKGGFFHNLTPRPVDSVHSSVHRGPGSTRPDRPRPGDLWSTGDGPGREADAEAGLVEGRWHGPGLVGELGSVGPGRLVDSGRLVGPGRSTAQAGPGRRTSTGSRSSHLDRRRFPTSPSLWAWSALARAESSALARADVFANELLADSADIGHVHGRDYGPGRWAWAVVDESMSRRVFTRGRDSDTGPGRTGPGP